MIPTRISAFGVTTFFLLGWGIDTAKFPRDGLQISRVTESGVSIASPFSSLETSVTLTFTLDTTLNAGDAIMIKLPDFVVAPPSGSLISCRNTSVVPAAIGIMNGVPSSAISIEGVCTGYNPPFIRGGSSFVCGRKNNFIRWKVDLGTSDFTIQSVFTPTYATSTGLTFVLWSGATTFQMGLDAASHTSTTFPRMGLCAGDHIGDDIQHSVQACSTSCTGECKFFSFCSNAKAACSGTNSNRCVRYKSCGSSSVGGVNSSFVSFHDWNSGALLLRANQQHTIVVKRTRGLLTITLDSTVLMPSMNAPIKITGVGWRPWDNIISVKRLMLQPRQEGSGSSGTGSAECLKQGAYVNPPHDRSCCAGLVPTNRAVGPNGLETTCEPNGGGGAATGSATNHASSSATSVSGNAQPWILANLGESCTAACSTSGGLCTGIWPDDPELIKAKFAAVGVPCKSMDGYDGDSWTAGPAVLIGTAWFNSEITSSLAQGYCWWNGKSNRRCDHSTRNDLRRLCPCAGSTASSSTTPITSHSGSASAGSPD